MSSEELSELQEHAEHAKHKPELAPVSLTMAILAVMVAIATLLGHRAHTEEVVQQAKASDQWAFYQAKNIRRHNDEIFTDLTSVTATNTDHEAVAKLQEKYPKKRNATKMTERNRVRGPQTRSRSCHRKKARRPL